MARSCDTVACQVCRSPLLVVRHTESDVVLGFNPVDWERVRLSLHAALTALQPVADHTGGPQTDVVRTAYRWITQALDELPDTPLGRCRGCDEAFPTEEPVR